MIEQKGGIIDQYTEMSERYAESVDAIENPHDRRKAFQMAIGLQTDLTKFNALDANKSGEGDSRLMMRDFLRGRITARAEGITQLGEFKLASEILTDCGYKVGNRINK